MKSNIEAERARIGISRTELANHIGVAPQTVTKYILNVDSIPSGKLCMMADLFGVTTDYLLNRCQRAE